MSFDAIPAADPECPGCIDAAECPVHGRLIPPGWSFAKNGTYLCDGAGLCCWTYSVEDAWRTYADNGAMPCSTEFSWCTE